MKKITIPIIIILSILILSGMQLMPRKEAKTETKPAAEETKAPAPAPAVKPETEKTDITVSGRLILTTSKKSEMLSLHGKDAVMYRIVGSRSDELKSLLEELGSNNLVSVRGIKHPLASFIRCRHAYDFDPDGNKTVKTECIPYYNLDVSQILDTKISGEEMPPPKRDLKEEARARQQVTSQEIEKAMPQLISIQGTISSVNIRSPIKTLEVSFTGARGEALKKTVLITANTYIAKKDSSGQPVPVDVQSLRPGQKVNVEYSRTERTSEALIITLLD
jgi:hypothetical protein